MLAFFLACATETNDSGATAAPAVTWYGDVESIVSENCSGCHVAGGVGAFPLDNFEAASPMAGAMADAVAARRMPPWKAVSGCDEYRGDISLTDDEIARITAWSDLGAPEGDVSKSLRVEPAVSSLTRVDHTLSLPTPYVPQIAPDDYRCFLIDWPETAPTFITGYRVNPDATAVVHHLVAYLASPAQAAAYTAIDAEDDAEGWTCYGGPGVGDPATAEWIGGWAPGAQNGDFPNGTGIYVAPGSKVVLQMHYNTATAEAEADQTTMDIMVAGDVEFPAYVQPWADPSWLFAGMDIPANSEGTSHSFTYTFDESEAPFRVHTANLHMHQLGKTAELRIDKADSSEDCMLAIDDWDFNWQRTYVLAEPKEIAPGDAITIECSWKNPTDSDIAWGEGTGDEMCLGTMLFSL